MTEWTPNFIAIDSDWIYCQELRPIESGIHILKNMNIILITYSTYLISESNAISEST